MPSFRNLKDLEKYVENKVRQTILKDKSIQDTFKDAMQVSVYTEVYDYYRPSTENEPFEYERRYTDGGLGDTDNMVFTSHKLNGKTFESLFENVATGSDSPVYGLPTDSMNNYFISEMIEIGDEDDWYDPDGDWSDPRPFAKATAQRLNSTYSSRIKKTLENGINK